MVSRMRISVSADRFIGKALVVVHLVLLAWAIIGFAEMLLSAVPWPAISNPLFSSAMLLLQWVVVSAAAATFLLGYFRRWPRLPRAMVAWYVVMAVICAYQNFTILQHPTRFIEMTLEYAAYVAIGFYLFLSPTMRECLQPRT